MVRNIKDKLFYQYIYERNNGYVIQYKNEVYGWYPDLATALFDRDRFIMVDWNFSLFVELPDIPNPYEHMELPPLSHDKEYIVRIPETWRVQKRVNGKTQYYGTFKSYEEAKTRRDELIANGWCKE